MLDREVIDRLLEKAQRLQLAIALYEYNRPAPKRGRRATWSDDDIAALIEWEPRFRALYAAKGRTFSRSAWVAEQVRSHWGIQGKRLDRAVKAIVKRMMEKKKKTT